MVGQVVKFSRPPRSPSKGPRLWVAAAVMLPAFIAGIILARSVSTQDAAPEACRITDGDTIRCGDERIRLLGIDAPEMPGHCRPGRHCALGDPYASSESLAAAIGPHMTITRVGTDRYGRTLASVSGPYGDLSCWQLANRQAIYRAEWDNGLRVARTCPTSVL